MANEELINISIDGSISEKLALFSFDNTESVEIIYKKFRYFSKSNYSRYFKGNDAPFHKEMILNMIRSYRGENYINLAFRGSSKTSLAKLFLAFVILNDQDHFRRYIKIISRDIKNPKQVVTDVFNMLIDVNHIYGNVFEKEGEKKHEERMDSFTMKSGVKLTAGTCGQSQRGHAQDAYRPDWLIFDDIEDRESVSSQAITESVIMSLDEAIAGLDKGGSWTLLGNYISENGSIQWFLDKKNVISQITPILKDGKSTWDIYTLAEIERLKTDSEDFYGEYLCLKPDTLIATEKGLKEIQYIKEGDKIWTHLHRLKKVLKVFKSNAEDLLDITIEGKITTITKNHPVYVYRNMKRQWIKAGELLLTDLIL